MRDLRHQDEDVLLAITVWGEARGQSSLGRSAVAHVVLNRMKEKNLSVADTVLRKWQFSCFNANDPNRHKLLDPVQSEGLGAWAVCWRAAVEAMTGQSADPTFGATHYCTLALWNRPSVDASTAKWFEQPCIDGRATVETARIGNHVFAKTRW